MPIITLKTIIKADKDIVFDLSRSIDLHKISTKRTREEAIAGKTTGLIGLNESVTWRAKHLGFYQHLTSKITEYNRPNFFSDEMQNGAFKRFKHDHYFEATDKGTLMTDIFDYTSPFGVLGKFVDWLFLKQYMRKLLVERNKIIQSYAESDDWKSILSL